MRTSVCVLSLFSPEHGVSGIHHMLWWLIKHESTFLFLWLCGESFFAEGVLDSLYVDLINHWIKTICGREGLLLTSKCPLREKQNKALHSGTQRQDPGG